MDKICLNCAKHFTPRQPHHNYCYSCWIIFMDECRIQNQSIDNPKAYNDMVDWYQDGIAPHLNASIDWDDDRQMNMEYFRLCWRDEDYYEQ